MPAAKPYVILLNGPPGCGKDTGGAALHAEIPNSRVMKFARRLKESVHADYGSPALPHEYFEFMKDQPSPFFFGKTPRQAYITKSERMVKPVLGNDFYGRVFLRDLLDAAYRHTEVVIVTDSGFAVEAAPVVNYVGHDNVLLVRIHAEGRGKTFAGDSRTHLHIPGVERIDVYNDDEEEDYLAVLKEDVGDWLFRARANAPYRE